MEMLKSLSEVCEPDVRYKHRVDLDTSTGAVSETTIESLYSLIEAITLNTKVPEDVRNHFETARNLALYSWFVYTFNVVAAMHAYASLEMALRTKTGDKKSPFKQLLDTAFDRRELTGGFGPPVDLSLALSRMRNDLAHGSRTLHSQGIPALRMCAELINELFA